MSDAAHESTGDRIGRFRREAGFSLNRLAVDAQVSKGYLWSLENEPNKRPSAETLHRIGEVLGVTVNDLLGRPFADLPTRVPDELSELADAKGLPACDVRMLAGIEFRGVRPRSRERWEYIYNAIRLSQMLDA